VKTAAAKARGVIEVTAPCPLCKRGVDLRLEGAGRPVICPSCKGEVLVQLGDSFFERGAIDRCVLCSCQHLYLQKDFSQRAGCAILGAGSVLGLILAGVYGAMWLWAVLFATAGLDWLLYRIIPDVVICYRCKAHYRGMAEPIGVGPFDLQLADAIDGKMGGGLPPVP
jgi:hypothetical protein